LLDNVSALAGGFEARSDAAGFQHPVGVSAWHLVALGSILLIGLPMTRERALRHGRNRREDDKNKPRFWRLLDELPTLPTVS